VRALFVTPVEEGSGETITSVHVAERLAARGWSVGFLGSPFALKFVPPALKAQAWALGAEGRVNRAVWDAALRAFHPDVILFADYPLMFFRRGSAPLAREPGWSDSLAHVDAALITLDHFGFTRAGEGLFLGPPHFGIVFQEFPPLPDGMHVLLPCPMHEPGDVPERIGVPFRYWNVPMGVSAGQRAAIRSRWLGGDASGLLVFHFVPNWAAQHARKLGLPFYDFLPRLLEWYLAPLGGRVRIVSVNNGSLLRATGPTLRIDNLASVSKEEFEALLFAADLVLTENGLSISVGKAVCGRQVAAVLRNSFTLSALMADADPPVQQVLMRMEAQMLGSVYPYEAFPTVTPRDLAAIGLYADNSLAQAFARLEVFGGSRTAAALEQLLTDDRTRSDLIERQQGYIDRLARLDDVADTIGGLAAHG
jgi:hypothetical protein